MDKDIFKKNIKEKRYKYIVSFPHIGNYYIPIYNWFVNIFDKYTTKVLIPKKMSNKTLEYGSNNSPDYICLPFKYNVGNFIESLESGANVLVQAGGGCKYGYYSELQFKILKDMGYNFKEITLIDKGKIKPIKIYRKIKNINPKLSFFKFAYRFVIAALIAYSLDKFEDYMRNNICYEVKKGSFDILHLRYLNKLKNIQSLFELLKINIVFFKKLKNIKLIPNKDREQVIKIGIIGELFTSMEQFSSNNIERELLNLGAATKRYTTLTYLMVKKPLEMKRLIKKSSKYIEYELGADGTVSVAHAIELADKGYDGIIHIKPFGCTPEENAIPILQKISSDRHIPIMYLTFDTETSITGFKTRLEAFYDMLSMKKERNNLISNFKGEVYDAK